MPDEDVVLITQAPSDSWFEGFVIRPNGKVLATRLDKPELYTFEPEDEDAVPQLVCTLPDCNSLVNICPIPGYDDEYFVLASTADLEAVTHKDAWLWRIIMGSDEGASPKTIRVTSVPEEGYCLGVKAVSDRVVLLPDGKTSCIWHLDTETGTKTLFADDKSMERGAGDGFFGVNRIQIVGNYVYFTNSSGGSICRIPVEFDPSRKEVGIRTAGPVETIIDDLPSNLDGLAVSSDQTHAYVASHIDGHLHKVQIDPTTGKGTSRVILSSLDNPTGVNLDLSPNSPGKMKLYIVCCGEIEVAWMPREDNPWEAIRDINSAVTVTVTQEVVETSS
ncbi:hypothetical protein ONZ43_g2725 [Nemania bipapillata]|uniref:Uncharacterized protein n=1 Tax=Nemania bipapillata TaxID=110536 RepID=A0ACC2IZQ3_9PEZI|nr:hypothetical protein ONZ43_g2725 [Nemania bipapillata]